MKYIKTFEDFVNESISDKLSDNDIVIIATTYGNKKHKYKRSEIQKFINSGNTSSDDLPKWLLIHYMELDKRSRNPHKTSKYVNQQVENKLNSLVKHSGEPEEMDLSTK